MHKERMLPRSLLSAAAIGSFRAFPVHTFDRPASGKAAFTSTNVVSRHRMQRPQRQRIPKQISAKAQKKVLPEDRQHLV
jgi:hypothetical protein